MSFAKALNFSRARVTAVDVYTEIEMDTDLYHKNLF